MGLRLYNTLTRQKEAFEPVNAGQVGLYLCGPTVYKPSHIGHAVGPIIFDALKRYLTQVHGYQVTWIVNVTDVEDKLIAEATNLGCGVFELAERVTKSYVESMRALGIEQGSGGIDHMPKASEHIPGIVDCIRRLIDRAAAYVSDGDVYFNVTADADYGKLSNRNPEEQSGERELRSGPKKHPGDFALWKAAKPDEPAEVKFDSPWGPGRPGWHIECSAMSMKLLGETFDIHGGGLDLIFPHHENEIAQSETATGKTFSRVWMHHGLTRFNTKKISKSDPEMQAALEKMTLTNLLQKYSGELLRFFILSTHYRRPIEFNEEELESKKKALSTFYRLFERVERVTGTNPFTVHSNPQSAIRNPQLDDFRQRYLDALDDDFNTAAAIAVLFEMNTAINRQIEEAGLESKDPPEARQGVVHSTGELIALARLLGLFLKPVEEKSAGDDEWVGKLMQVFIDIRKHCKKQKDFATADLIRARLMDIGITLEDRPGGTGWSRNG